MSEYPPPTEILTIYNESLFTSLNDPLTINYANNKYVNLTSTQIITGDKTFNGTTSWNGTCFIGSSGSLRISSPSAYAAFVYGGALNSTLTLPNSTGTLALTSQIPTNSSYVDLTTNQTVGGNKTFTGSVIGNSLSSTKQFCATMQTGAIGSTSTGSSIFVIFQGVGSATYNPSGYFTCDDGNGSIAFTVSGTLPQFFMVTANISWASNSTGYRRIYVDGGGTTYLDSIVSAVNGEDTRMMASRIFAINSTGTFTLVCRILQNSGGNLNYGVGSSNPTTFGIYKLT